MYSYLFTRYFSWFEAAECSVVDNLFQCSHCLHHLLAIINVDTNRSANRRYHPDVKMIYITTLWNPWKNLSHSKRQKCGHVSFPVHTNVWKMFVILFSCTLRLLNVHKQIILHTNHVKIVQTPSFSAGTRIEQAFMDPYGATNMNRVTKLCPQISRDQSVNN